jgi:His-Xaa-Ser system protein HxsD
MKTFKFSKELYSKIPLLKAAYNFTNQAYVHLDCDSENYYVQLQAKQGKELPDLEEFENEMLMQNLRHEINEDTKNIRQLIMARAMASSVIEIPKKEIMGLENNESDSMKEDEILQDWFDQHE